MHRQIKTVVVILAALLAVSCANELPKQKKFWIRYKLDGVSYSAHSIKAFSKMAVWLTWGSTIYTNYYCEYNFTSDIRTTVNLPRDVQSGSVYVGAQNIPVIDPRDGSPMFLTFDIDGYYPITNFVFTVTTFDRTALTCSGTFEGGLTNAAGNTNMVTDGTFEGEMYEP